MRTDANIARNEAVKSTDRVPDLSMPVLVVDDYNTMIRIIRNLLKQIGFHDIDDAHDGASALEKMGIRKYGLVICDANMEPMTGLDVLHQIRADPFNATVPFLLVTNERLKDAAALSKADGYIVKPFNVAALKQRIETIFAERP